MKHFSAGQPRRTGSALGRGPAPATARPSAPCLTGNLAPSRMGCVDGWMAPLVCAALRCGAWVGGLFGPWGVEESHLFLPSSLSLCVVGC